MITADAIRDTLGQAVGTKNTLTLSGRITKVIGLILESDGPKAPIGEVCIIRNRSGREICKSEIVGFRDNKILSMVLGDLKEISPGTEIVASGESLSINVGDELLGRILGGMGNPIDGLGEITAGERRSIYALPPDPLKRKRIFEPVATGIKAIDTMLTLGKGQRMGIFSGSGIGKSTIIGMIARNTSADINVIALIGERGREVREFLEKDLREEGLKRSVVIIAPSDNPPLVRVKGALVATTIAEYFREKGLDVMFMMDSATRLAMAQREVGLAIGEPPTTKGYTPSVFSLLQRTMERAGTSIDGSITALYSVLVEGDDINEPISDASRGILDGHIVLARRLANLGHYPAIDVLQSISRVRNDVISKEHFDSILKVQELMAAYREAEDLISVGAYQKGTNPVIDKAMSLNDRINAFLKQGIYESTEYEESVEQLKAIASS
ncbi:MAG: EscN/YscN/HrcN family type III secretion system ATPase [Ignavibacteria bacterium GWB2_35_12]|nr:MAG: EscN/YscN/HrcN family type III secretion system ATPase [Ignavibacteria bacterium GWA2_35_8]OGU41228.1 MAG: EscN/YscN/HrcN family type III secretion system ATPase [Ignavibacteria bacterium GWB2_35_12]OGU86766.1 MAG: EscN/YscN/HrcN family type III secretion system ATPase [Ignavibacteria bacterium RIFOXYA2_FULL_35_10]OGV23151.1 MAG: EscN/YscN/HrcN family type III secretion system ATPase [Ignavibacteria bacterium RIFOXYC2_FULL_35_21]